MENKYLCPKCNKSFKAKKWHITTYKLTFPKKSFSTNKSWEEKIQELECKLDEHSKNAGTYFCPRCKNEIEGFEIDKAR